jgi:hypothetical protein
MVNLARRLVACLRRVPVWFCGLEHHPSLSGSGSGSE